MYILFIYNFSSILKNFTEVIVLTHPTNFGYGQALITGMKSAKRSNIIWMDGDGQHQVEDVVKLANNLLPEDVDFVIGERGKSSLQSTSRILGKYFLRLIIKFNCFQALYIYAFVQICSICALWPHWLAEPYQYAPSILEYAVKG